MPPSPPTNAEIEELIRRAEEHHEAKRYEEAYALYTEGIALAPDNARLYAERGNELMWLDRSAEAIADLTEAIRLDPTKAYFFRTRGIYFQTLEDHAAAVQDFTEAVRLDPENPWTYELRGESYQNDESEQAGADFRQAIALGSKNVDPFIWEANRAVDAKEWSVVAEVCLAGLKHWPEDDHLLFFYGRSLFELERFEEALEPLAFAARLDPDSAGCVDFHARCLWELDRYAEAIPVYDHSLRLDPSDYVAWYQRGFCHWMEDDYDQALADLTESLRLAPGYPVALELRGKVFIHLGQPKKALRDLSRAIRGDPEERDYRLTRADALSASGQHELALTELQGLIVAEPEEKWAYWHRAQILRELEEYDDAIDAYERYLALGGDERNAMMSMGVCYTHLQDVENIFSCFRRAAELEPDSATHLFYCGYALGRMGDSEEARQLFTEALALDPASWTAFYHRGGTWETEDQFELALADYTRAIEIAPPDEAKPLAARAGLYELLEDYSQALADLDALVRIEPHSARHLWHRAELWDTLGRSDLADADATAAEQLEADAEGDSADGDVMIEDKMKIWTALQEHFGGVPLEEITLTERHFPVQVGADLQKALDTLADAGLKVLHFWAARQCGSPIVNFSDAYVKNRRNPALAGSPRYLEIDIGESESVRALRDGLWVLKAGRAALVLILDTSNYQSIRFQVAALSSAGPAASKVFRHLEDTVRRSPCYRGKILSLECREMYSGQNQGLRVHQLRAVTRGDVILPKSTLDQLDRNVTRFVQHRARLIELGLTGKKGLLFHGPPGTGKTHTIHYLAQSVTAQTTFLISANQVGILDEYMTLARLYQPSLVVIEDVDLIARQREDMRSAGEEVLLNKLLNEMDGLHTDAAVMFILTTNRPEALEAALASRPGRIDQAIEFPLPDAEGRAKLARLYSGKLRLSDKIVTLIVSRTAGLTASFLKELMRRAAQFALERGESRQLNEHDVETALEELLLLGGSLNRKLLGFAEGVTANRAALA